MTKVNWHYSLHVMPPNDNSFAVETVSPVKAANLARYYQKSGWSCWVAIDVHAMDNFHLSTEEYSEALNKAYAMGSIRAWKDVIERRRPYLHTYQEDSVDLERAY